MIVAEVKVLGEALQKRCELGALEFGGTPNELIVIERSQSNAVQFIRRAVTASHAVKDKLLTDVEPFSVPLKIFRMHHQRLCIINK